MLELNDIHTFYGLIEAFEGITLKVNQGEIVCLIGNNGAGKIHDADGHIRHIKALRQEQYLSLEVTSPICRLTALLKWG